MTTRRQLLGAATVALAGSTSGCSVLGGDEELSADRIASLVHERVNGKRSEHGVRDLNYDDRLAADATGHSRDMARRNFFDHTNPDGEGPQERSSIPCPVGENIAQTYHDKRIEVEEEGTVTLRTNQEVANGLVHQWMHSEGHRENILDPRYHTEGVGIYLAGDDEVFATQMFCRSATGF